jgi:translation initiation factor 1 (eIF-1/SUI1)
VNHLQKKEELPEKLSFLGDPKSLVRIWAEEIRKARQLTTVQNLETKEKELTRYLEEHLKLLSAKKKTLEKSLTLRGTNHQELRGLLLQLHKNLSPPIRKNR